MSEIRLRAFARWTAHVICIVWTVSAARADDTSSSGSLVDAGSDNQLRPFCTDRPTKGTGPCTVDMGHFQIESDILNVTMQNSGGIVTDSWAYTSPNMKFGLTDNMDVEVNITPYIEVQTHDHHTGKTIDESGFGDMFLRLKTSLVGNGAGLFSAALDPFLKLPTAAPGIGDGAVEAGAVLPLQLSPNDAWSIYLDPEADILKNMENGGRHIAGLLALGVTRAISSQISASAEFWLDVDSDPTGSTAQKTFDIAATWQPPDTKDLQFDAGANFGLNSESPGAQLYVGISQRF